MQLMSYFYSQKAGWSLTFIDHEVILVPRETGPIAQHCERPMKIVKLVYPVLAYIPRLSHSSVVF